MEDNEQGQLRQDHTQASACAVCRIKRFVSRAMVDVLHDERISVRNKHLLTRAIATRPHTQASVAKKQVCFLGYGVLGYLKMAEPSSMKTLSGSPFGLLRTATFPNLLRSPSSHMGFRIRHAPVFKSIISPSA